MIILTIIGLLVSVAVVSSYLTFVWMRAKVNKEMVAEINRINLTAEQKAIDKNFSRIVALENARDEALEDIKDLEESLRHVNSVKSDILRDNQRLQSAYSNLYLEFVKYKNQGGSNPQLISALQEERNKTAFYQQQVASLQYRIQQLMGVGSPQSFTPKELTILRMLVHPDKHGGNQKANDMFVKINSLLK